MLHLVKDPPALPIYVRAEEVRVGDQFWSGFGRHRKWECSVVSNNQGDMTVTGGAQWRYHRHSVLAVFRP